MSNDLNNTSGGKSGWQNSGLDDFDRLLASLFDGGLNDAQWDNLCQQMADDPHARQRYIQFVQLHSLLETRYSLQQNPTLPDGTDESTAVHGDAARELQNLARQQFHKSATESKTVPAKLPQNNKIPFSFSAVRFSTWRIAAILFFVASAVFALTSPLWWGWNKAAPLATLTDAVDAQWDMPQQLDVGDALPSGPLVLKAGYVHIALSNGVNLVLKGPAHFSVNSLMRVQLDVGKLTADVPHTAMGFTVKTPRASVTDLGTTFGVTAFANGEGEVQVLKGKVQAKLLDEDGATKAETELTEDHAAAFNSNLGTLASIPVQPDAYITDIHRIPVPLVLHNTGAGLKLGNADPYWQITGNTDDPAWTPRPANVTVANPPQLPAYAHSSMARVENDPAKSQWLGTRPDFFTMRDNCRLTFRTTVDLTGFDADSARLHLAILADDDITELRVNGKATPFGMADPTDYSVFHSFTIDHGLVAGKNTLEFTVQNRAGAMGLRVELDGTAVLQESH